MESTNSPHNEPPAQPTGHPGHDLGALIAAAASSWTIALGSDGGLSSAAKEAIRATARLILATLDHLPISAPPDEAQRDEPDSTIAVQTPPLGSTPIASHVTAATGTEPGPVILEPAPPSDDSLLELTTKFNGSAVSPRITTPVAASVARGMAERPALSLLARRAALCARACDWAIRRHDNMERFDLVKPEYDAIRDEAGSMQPLYLWMIHRDTIRIARDDWVRLAGCYHNMAAAAELVASFGNGGDAAIDLVGLLSEAQSMVFSSLGMVEIRDTVQQNIFEWCIDEAQGRKVFVAHLSVVDQANPALCGGLRARIEAARERCAADRRRESTKRKQLNTVRYHVNQVLEDEDADHGNDWNRIDEAIGLFLESGGKPSDPDLIGFVVPISELLPDDFAMREATFRRLAPFVDQRLARESPSRPESDDRRSPSPELIEARELLRGKVAVLIGGEAREPARRVLEQELELKELRWLSSREHESISSFIPDIRRSETALVLLAIRWASHSFEDVQATCNQFDKPYVRLPAGYGANRVAYEIIRQQGDRLRVRRS